MNMLLENDQTSGNDWGPRGGARVYHRQKPWPAIPGRVQLSELSDLENQMREYEAEFKRLLTDLSTFFIFADPNAVWSFLRTHRSVVSILLDGAPYLRKSFGDGVPLTLEVVSDDGPPVAINALAVWRGDSTGARAALRAFDEVWWLKNLHGAGGRIVFDVELVR